MAHPYFKKRLGRSEENDGEPNGEVECYIRYFHLRLLESLRCIEKGEGRRLRAGRYPIKFIAAP
jgi:hypothetical protein